MGRYSRRDFLRIGATGSAATVAGIVDTKAEAEPSPSQGEPTPAPQHRHQNPPNPARVVHSVCGICFWKCGITAEIGENGELLHVRGNPNHPLNRGKLCPRGAGGVGFHEDSNRLEGPMIRTGERGEAVFRQVSWDEAFQEVGSRLRGIIEEDGPGAIALLTHGSSESHYGHLAEAIGTPHHTHPAYDQCKGPREVGFKLTFGTPLKSPEPLDIENTDCLVLIGSHLGENMHNLQVQEMVTARTRGAKIIVVDPRRSVAAERADAWLPIRPGTDIALLLAWMHVLIDEGRVDEEFIRDYCDGFEELSEHVAQCTPEWAAQETNLPAEEIIRTARMIGRASPHVCFHCGRHVVWYGDDTQRSRAIAILVAITGSWGTRGGYYLPNKVHLPSIHEAFPSIPPFPQPVNRRDPGYPFGIGVNVNGIRQATLDERIKAWIVSGTNLITTLPNPAETRAAIQKLDLLIVVDILPTEITQFADILLPAASYLERPDPLVVTNNRDPYVAIRQPAAEPIGESMCECWMAMRIGRELDLLQYWDWTSMRQVQQTIIEKHNEQHPEESIDFEQLERDGVVVFNDERPIYRAGQGLGADGSGRAGRELHFPEFDGTPGNDRIKLYSTDLDRAWREKVTRGEDATGFEALPTFYRQRIPPPGHVRLLYGRSPVHSFGRTQNNPILHGREPENDIWVSPRTAEAYGISDKEYCEIINQDEVREGPIRVNVTSRIRDDCVYMSHGHGHNSRQLSRAYNRGADDCALMTRYAVDPLSGGTGMRVNFVRLVRPHAL